MILAGALRELLEFYTIVETQSESGYKKVEEVFKFKVRAQRTKNKEKYTADAEELFHTTELTFRCRYRKDIKDTDIVVYEGERYRITSLDKFIDANQLTIIISKIKKTDIRKMGSGNPGTLNVSRSLGLGLGLLTFLLDVLKGAVPTLIAFFISNSGFSLSWITMHKITTIAIMPAVPRSFNS